MSNPLAPFMPAAETIREVRVEKGISLQDSRAHLIRRNMADFTEAAETVEELRTVVRALVSLARFS